MIVTSGAQQAIALLAALYVRSGDTVVLENPTYPGAIDAFLAVGAQLAQVAVGPDGARVAALRARMKSSSTSLVYLVPTFQNPTGTLMPAANSAEVIRAVEESGTPLIEDATLSGLSFGPSPPLPLGANPGRATVITVGSLGKIFWGGLRLGWVRAPEPVVSALTRLKAMSDLGTSIPVQLIGVRLLHDVDAIARFVRRRSARTTNSSPSCSTKRFVVVVRFPAGGLSLWVKLPNGKATEFSQVALRHGVAIAPDL